MRIGFFDYDLNNFHPEHYLGLLRGPLAGRGFTVSACHGLREQPSRQWADSHGVAYAASVDELAERSDVLMILAPSNPELHESMAEAVLPFGRRTYIDKTFAPDLAAARRIFALADRHRAPVVTSSALRCTDELAALDRGTIRQLQMWGGGSNFAEYAIHPVEAVVSTLGPDVTHALRAGDDQYGKIHLRFADGRSADVFVTVATPCPFLAVSTTATEVKFHEIRSDFFLTLINRVANEFGREVRIL